MPSLFSLLFDSMAFAAARERAKKMHGGAEPTLGVLSDYIELLPDEDLRAGNGGEIVDAPAPDAEPGECDLWSYDATSDPSLFSNLRCRVRDEDYRDFQVLDSLEFGSGFGGVDFAQMIRVNANGKELELQLSEEARIASFYAWGGNDGNHPLWRLENRIGWSVVHAFLYDLDPVSSRPSFTKALPPDHPDYPELQKFKQACELLRNQSEDARPAMQTLCTDNLWLPLAGDIAGVLGLDPLSGVHALESVVKMTAMTPRILVLVNLVGCTERNDYQPGSPGGVARLYPVVMVRSNIPLAHADAAIRFTRPTTPSESCSCSELNQDMHALVVADADRGNLQYPLPSVFPGPFPTWNNIFNYYVDDAQDALGGAEVPVVRRSRTQAAPDDNAAPIERKFALNAHKITRAARQGAFDNIHVAPTMSMPERIAIARVYGAGLLATNSAFPNEIPVDQNLRDAWRLNRVTMAPFCVHDCFHMHWRWSSESTEPGTFGFQNGVPSALAGAPMVPENQDVSLRVTAGHQFIYAARAYDVGMEEWQIFCHHGAGYLVSVGQPMKDARQFNGVTMPYLGVDSSGVVFADAQGHEISGADSWAVFYWHLQYFLANQYSPDPSDRVIIDDLAAVEAE